MKVRVGLRKHWESPKAAAQEALNTLIELLGYQVHVEIDSAQLWSDLEKFYPDPETFAPNITTVVQTWAECLTARLQDDANAAWTEKLLDVVAERGTVVKAHVESQPGSQVRTTWSKEASEFVIFIPETTPPYSNFVASTVSTDLQNLFEESCTTSAAASKAGDDDWATVDIPTGGSIPARITPTALPSVNTLARPEVMFASQVPYQMIVQIVHNGISVQGSHQSSLQLMKEYFEKYARVDRSNSNKIPTLKIEFQPSLFGYGNLFDSLTISPSSPWTVWDNINPVLVLSFVESVLQYKIVSEMSAGGRWYYRRDVAFK